MAVKTEKVKVPEIGSCAMTVLKVRRCSFARISRNKRPQWLGNGRRRCVNRDVRSIMFGFHHFTASSNHYPF